jgi:hypothetical protein
LTNAGLALAPPGQTERLPDPHPCPETTGARPARVSRRCGSGCSLSARGDALAAIAELPAVIIGYMASNAAKRPGWAVEVLHFDEIRARMLTLVPAAAFGRRSEDTCDDVEAAPCSTDANRPYRAGAALPASG